VTGMGPFPMHVVTVAVAALLAWGVARMLARRVPGSPSKAAGTLVVDALFVGLLAARIGYLLRWWPEYAAAPWSMLSIGDAGFAWWSGMPAAVAFAWWRTRNTTALRRPVLAGIAAGILAWAAAGGALWWMHRAAAPLPDIALARVDGTPVRLDHYRGRPLVLNLWATWCPPCRREMPVLEHAQARYPGVSFVLVNQGEGREEIERFLAAEGLRLRDVLRDPHSQAMHETGARGLPTTLFFDADGRQVDTHMGELTRASLADTLRRRFDASPSDPPQTE